MDPWVLAAAFGSSLIVSLTLVRLSIVVAGRTGHLDHPDGDRKIQSRPIPKLGGVAVAATFAVIVSAVVLAREGRGTTFVALGVLLPALAMAVVGFIDDRHPLNPWVRLCVQALIAGWAWYAGTRITLFPQEWLNLIVFILWVVMVVNAINMLDNSDGLAGSTALVASLASGVIGLLFGQYLVAALAFALAGVAAGFLWHNWYPAKVYLGDSGAYFLGFLLAIVTVRLRPVDVPLGWNIVIPVLLLALPLVDLVYVVIRRLARRVHPFTAGRDHLAHSIQRRGASVPGTVVILQAFLVATCGAAVGVAVSA